MNTSYQGAQMQGMMGGPPAQHGYGPPPGYQGMPANATGAAYVPETPMPVHYQPQQGVGHPGHGPCAATHGMPPAPGAHGGMQPGVETTVQQGVAATEHEPASFDAWMAVLRATPLGAVPRRDVCARERLSPCSRRCESSRSMGSRNAALAPETH
mgnify:CR=1 FL=1